MRSQAWKVPRSDAKAWTPYRLRARKVLVLADLHVPYHNQKAIAAALAFGAQYQPDALLLLGDFLDCHQLSRFIRDPRKRNFAKELQVARQMLQCFREALPTVQRIVYKLGNHDDRYEAFMLKKAPELYDMEHFQFANVIGAEELGVEIVTDKRIVRLGRLPAIHGHEYIRSVMAPVNAARGFFLRAKASVMAAHHHMSSEHQESNIDGKIIVTWSVGCLCDLHPEYARLNRWGHGFATVDITKNRYHVDNRKILDGEVL